LHSNVIDYMHAYQTNELGHSSTPCLWYALLDSMKTLSTKIALKCMRAYMLCIYVYPWYSIWCSPIHPCVLWVRSVLSHKLEHSGSWNCEHSVCWWGVERPLILCNICWQTHPIHFLVPYQKYKARSWQDHGKDVARSWQESCHDLEWFKWDFGTNLDKITHDLERIMKDLGWFTEDLGWFM